MARLIREAGDVPADLRRFVPRRWTNVAVDDGDSRLESLARRLHRSDLQRHWYATLVVAPALYRAALWEAVGESNGDRYFYAQMETSSALRLKLLAIDNAKHLP